MLLAGLVHQSIVNTAVHTSASDAAVSGIPPVHGRGTLAADAAGEHNIPLSVG